MRAITISGPGGPETLTWSTVPDPDPGPDEVLIEVAATAVNRADLLQRAGHYPPPPGASPYPGLECAGRIVALGTNVDSAAARVGDEVCALLAGGGYAELVAVPVGQLLPVPEGLDLTESAALPEAACTVWSNVVDRGALRAGDTLLVHGGGSGVGTVAVQLGAALGATVIATARAAKHPALRSLGAHHVIDYTTTDFVAETRAVTEGRGADVILDIMGGSYLAGNVRALAPGGRLVVIGLQGGRRATLDIAALMARQAAVIGTTLRSRSPEQKAEVVRGVREVVWPLVEAGTVRPVVDRRLPMSRAAEAHEVVQRNEHLGKIILLRDPQPPADTHLTPPRPTA